MRRIVLVVGACVALLLGLGLHALAAPERDDPAGSASGQPTPVQENQQPNIVFVLLDDYSSDLLQYMDGYQALAAEGVSFSNFVTSNPLCCPSRASILTGKYPHNTGVLTNQWPGGGLGAFLLTGQEEITVGTELQDAGYRTGYFGKYLNGYKPTGGGGGQGEPVHPPAHVPPGWDEWLATGAAYQHFEYNLVSSVDGNAETVAYTGTAEGNYVTDVLADRAEQFIQDNASAPFVVMINPFAVHGRVGKTPDPRARARTGTRRHHATGQPATPAPRTGGRRSSPAVTAVEVMTGDATRWHFRTRVGVRRSMQSHRTPRSGTRTGTSSPSGRRRSAGSSSARWSGFR